MNLERTEDSASRFARFVEELTSVIGHADRERPLNDYCAGLLASEGRRSVEPIAAVTAPCEVPAQHQRLLHFVANASWSDAAVLGKVRELILPGLHRKAYGKITDRSVICAGATAHLALHLEGLPQRDCLQSDYSPLSEGRTFVPVAKASLQAQRVGVAQLIDQSADWLDRKTRKDFGNAARSRAFQASAETSAKTGCCAAWLG